MLRMMHMHSSQALPWPRTRFHFSHLCFTVGWFFVWVLLFCWGSSLSLCGSCSSDVLVLEQLLALGALVACLAGLPRCSCFTCSV